MSATPRAITLIGKPGCHLCDEARTVVHSVVAATDREVEIRELSILDDEQLYRKHWDEIPVVLVDDRVHAIWRVDPSRLAAALNAD